MLTDFFELDSPYEEFDDNKLVDHFRNSRDLRSVLYRPNEWPIEQRKNKSLTFTNVSFSKTKFQKITFSKCVFEDCLFIGSILDEVEFHRCEFKNCNFYKTRINDCYFDPETVFFDPTYRRKHSNIGVHLYQQIYENSSNTGQYDFEREADIQFRRWKRWQLDHDKETGKISNIKCTIKKLSSVIYEYAAGFGYKPFRFILSTFVVFTALSLINMKILPGYLRHHGEVIHDMTLSDSIFYTYSMLTTLGFSTTVPDTGYAKVIAVSEALLGIGWLGIFTALLVKRFIK